MDLKKGGKAFFFAVFKCGPHGEAGRSQRGGEAQVEKKIVKQRTKSLPLKRGSRAGKDESERVAELAGKASGFFHSEVILEGLRAPRLR